ncbi:PAS domain-containing sensor histidine kinase [Halobaculum marinum]|uniref:histidine kinase n=1 Tax=Halobaculum marinum TaxID=3031996 RepID=A0ABD5X326_9EURY|nr:PAS domain S-box protein [Halobaculum sp. DT55]
MAEPSAHELLLDNTCDKVAVVDADGTFEYVNAAARRILGYDPDDLVGESVFDYIHPDDADRIEESFLATVQSDTTVATTETYRHRTADGSWVWFESRLSTLGAKELDGFVVSSRNVSDRVAAERRAARLDSIAAVSDDALWLFTADWSSLLYVNDAVEDIYGIAPDALFDDPIAFLKAVHPDDTERVVTAMDRLWAGDPVDIEYRVNPTEEFDRWVWVKATPVIDDGEVVCIAGFSRDVTDRHRREHHLIVVDNLLRHNVRNSLNVVLGATERIETIAPEAADAVETIRRAAEGLLESAEKERRIIETLTTPGACLPVRLGTQLSRAVDDVEGAHPAATVETDVRLPSGFGAAPSLVGTAVSELLENAIVHAEGDDPTVELRVRRYGDELRIEVRDEAPPLPSAEADVLRGQAHAHDPVYHNGGLGLWLVYWCVELSGGSLAIEQSVDGGNQITMHLPSGATSGADAHDGGTTAGTQGSHSR